MLVLPAAVLKGSPFLPDSVSMKLPRTWVLGTAFSAIALFMK